MQRRAALRIAALAALAVSLLAGAACLSPTLPLPPPEAPDTIRPSADHAGMWTINGDCYPGALVTLFNDRTQRGVVIKDSDENGRYSVEIEAEPCDLVQMWQDVATDEGTESSPTSSFVVEERDSTGVINDLCP